MPWLLKEPQSCPTCHITKEPPQPLETPGEHRDRGHPPAPHTTRGSPQPHRTVRNPHTAAVRGSPQPHSTVAGPPRAERPPGSGAARSSQSRGGAGRSRSGGGSRGWAIAAGPCPPHLPAPPCCRSAERQTLPVAARGRCSAGAAARRGGASREEWPRPLRDSGSSLVSRPVAQGSDGCVTEPPAHRPCGAGRGVLLSVIARAAGIGQCGG